MLQQANDTNMTDPIPPQTSLFHGARGIAVKVLTRVEQSDAYLDKLLNRELGSPELNDADRRLLNEIATGVLRWQGRLDWVLMGFYHGEFAKCLPVVRNAMRVALYQILFLTRIPHSAAVNESVEIIKRIKGARSASIVNGVLRSVIRRLHSISYPERTSDAPRYLAIMGSHPLWMVRRWAERFGGAATEQLLEANNRRPHLGLRVNPMRSSVEEALAYLKDRGIDAEPAPYASDVVLADGIGGIAGDRFFREGRYTVQDEAAVLACRLTGAKPGMRIIDLCAAPGGKTTALAEMIAGNGEIVAVDTYGSKLPQINEAAERLGLAGTIVTVEGDARAVNLPPADIVLVDAPCSGLGVLAKKPDIKWKRKPEDIEQMATLQQSIMRNAARLVRPGGCLVYATCTIEPEENQGIVRAFLAEHPEFALEDAAGLLPAEVAADGYLQTFPHIHNTDGMFAARLRRAE